MDPNAQAGAAPGAAPAGAKPDYLDKAFEQGAKKFGGAHGQKIAGDPKKREKITDGLRELFKKITGKQVNPKISN